MRPTFAFLACTLLIGTAPAWSQERISIGGAGSLVPATRELVQAYQAKNPTAKIDIVAESLGSSGGLKAAEAGRVAIALSGRPLRPEEKGKLVYRLVGQVPVVFAVHGAMPVTELTGTQICDIFAGRVRSWKELGGPDLRIVALTRNEDDSTKEAVRKHVGCYATLREGADVVVLTSGKTMIEALSNRPGSVGLTETAGVSSGQGRFKPVTLDGIAASPETVRSGRYKLVKHFGMATVGEPRGLAQRFLDFVAGPEGERAMGREGVIAVR